MSWNRPEFQPDESEIRVRLRAREFVIPPVRDALIIGRRSPVGQVAMQRSLALLSADAFEPIPVADHPTVSDLLVRRTVLLKVPRDRLVAFLLDRLGPLMGETEILQVDIEAQIELQGVV